jgi:hypothetical protein
MIPDFQTAEERSQWIKANADGFIVVRFEGRGVYKRYEFDTLTAAQITAKHLANQTGKVHMVYATSGMHDTWLENHKP